VAPGRLITLLLANALPEQKRQKGMFFKEGHFGALFVALDTLAHSEVLWLMHQSSCFLGILMPENGIRVQL